MKNSLLEARGHKKHFDPHNNIEIDVMQLLEGIELPKEHDIRELHRKLVTFFSIDELRHLSFELNVDFENFGSKRKRDFARELLLNLQRNDKVPQLVNLCQEIRPKGEW